MPPDLSQEIVSQLRQTRKYRFVCDPTLQRMADWAIVRHSSPKEALKAAKRKLHQVYGAYLDQVDLGRVEGLVETIQASMSREALHSVCREILECHVSTTERLALMADFYADLFGKIGQPSRVADLGCGLHPFAAPFIDPDGQTVYCACDIDRRLVALLRDFFERIDRPAEIEEQDLLVDVPAWKADVIFLFKTLPCLEQQEKGAGRYLLSRLQAPYVVVSFPTHSLGGRKKGMVQHYEKVMRRILEGLGACVDKMVYPEEVFYVIEKKYHVS